MSDTAFVAMLQRIFGSHWRKFAPCFNALRQRSTKSR
jgi:hypothetical protein